MAFPIIPKLNSAPGAGAPATLTLGELAANRSTAKLYMGTDTGVQELAFAGSLGGTATSTFTAAGGTSFAPLNGYTTTNVNAYLVSVGGIEQRPTVDWTISSAAGGTVIFATAPPSGATIIVRAVVAGSGGGSGGTDIGGRAWSSAATYTEGDLVATDQTSTWICIQADNTNHEPSASPLWWARMPASAVQLQFRPLAETAPTDGQAIVWDNANTTWKPGTVSGGGGNATQLQGRNIATTAPTAGQVLGWNSTTSKWEPTGGGGTVTFNTVGTHYWSVPASTRYARVQITTPAGTAGTNGQGTDGENGGDVEQGAPTVGANGTDGSGSVGTVGKSITFNGQLFSGGTAGQAGSIGYGGGGGGGFVISSQLFYAGAAGNGPLAGQGGGTYNFNNFAGGAGGGTAAAGQDGASQGGSTGCAGGGGGGDSGSGGGGGGSGWGTNAFKGGGGGEGGGGNGGVGAGDSLNTGIGGFGGKGGSGSGATAGGAGQSIDRAQLFTAGDLIPIVISTGAGTASCTITW